MNHEPLTPDALPSPEQVGLLWTVSEDEDGTPFIALWRPSDGAYMDVGTVHRILDAIVHYPEVAEYLIEALAALGERGTFPQGMVGMA